MTKMVTKIPHEYAGRRLVEGDEFECEPQYVPLLVRLGRAAVVDTENAFVGHGMPKAKFSKRISH